MKNCGGTSWINRFRFKYARLKELKYLDTNVLIGKKKLC
jgi:hypothetical protein